MTILNGSRLPLALLAAITLLYTSAMAGEVEVEVLEAHIVNIQVSEQHSTLMLSADLKGAFTEKIEEAFMSGMPVIFSYKVNLIRHRPNWWDATERIINVHKIVKYDSFAKEFNAIEVITPEAAEKKDFEKELAAIKEAHQATLFSEEIESGVSKELGSKSRYVVLKGIDTLKKWISALNDIPLGAKYDLPLSKKYYVEVMAEMDTAKLTPPFNYIFFFVSFLDFTTDWESSSPFFVEKADMPIQNMVGKKESK